MQFQSFAEWKNEVMRIANNCKAGWTIGGDNELTILREHEVSPTMVVAKAIKKIRDDMGLDVSGKPLG